MNEKRVNEWELSGLNPGKQFLTDFVVSLDSDHVYKSELFEKERKAIGELGCKLADLVLDIHGVDVIKVSENELRVFKLPTHTWEELTPLIRKAFKEVYGENIKFSYQNRLVLMIRRLRVELKS